MKNSLLPVLLLFSMAATAQIKQTQSGKVDYPSFLLLSNEIQEYRESRLIDQHTFLKFSQEPNTIILDTRSKRAYDDIHVKGAIHLNFSDFTEGKLAEVIPDKNTRILIYCNNNFRSRLSAMADKKAPLALNIPTFINLYGYGYKNLYELKGYYEPDELVIPMEEKGRD